MLSCAWIGSRRVRYVPLSPHDRCRSGPTSVPQAGRCERCRCPVGGSPTYAGRASQLGSVKSAVGGVLESAGRRRAGMATRWRRNDQERLSRLEAGRPPPGVRVGVRGCCPQPGSPRSRQAPSPRVVGPEVEPDGQVEDTGGQGCRAAAAVRAGVAVAGPLPGWRGSAAVVFVRPQARGGALPDVVQADLLRGSSVGPGRSRTARSVDAASWRGALSCPGSRPAPLRLRPPKTPPHRADRSGDVPDVRDSKDSPPETEPNLPQPPVAPHPGGASVLALRCLRQAAESEARQAVPYIRALCAQKDQRPDNDRG